MNYYKIRVHTDADGIDRANRIFLEHGVGGTEVYHPADPDFQKPAPHSWDFFDDTVFRDGTDTIYVAGYAESRTDADRIAASFVAEGFEADQVIIEEIASTDWEETWEQYFHPVAIGDDLLVLPSWETMPKSAFRAVVVIDPGEAFGTGTHETTAMCLEGLCRSLRAEDRVLDIGTGSGILAIAAAKLGARAITAIDIDRRAVETAGENMRLNGVDASIDLRLGDLAEGVQGEYDLIVANIVADAIVQLAGDVSRLLAPTGRLIASGILDTKCDEVVRALTAAGLTRCDVERRGEWVAVTAARA